MPWVERDEGGQIKGVYRNPQPGYAEEWIEDDALAALLPQALIDAGAASIVGVKVEDAPAPGANIPDHLRNISDAE